MNEKDLNTVDQVQQFLIGTQLIAFQISDSDCYRSLVLDDKVSRYKWIQSTLIRFNYGQLKRQEKGILIRYMAKISGYSRRQLTRLIQQQRRVGRLVRRQRTSNGFARRYTNADIQLIATLDNLHDQPNGKALKKLCERAYRVFGDSAYERLSTISVAHLYNLRKSKVYTRCRYTYTKTKPKASTIGKRRKPCPYGQPGYLRIDSVHQGDLDGRKGLYHINAVDEVTQMEVAACVEKISERFLIPALEQMFEFLPFVILGFHSDNGSEYVNKTVTRLREQSLALAKLLKKLHVEFTKSRARHSNDNALVECKNGHVIRKQFGHVHIPQHYADQVDVFNKCYLNAHINYHRPCLFPVTITDAKGKERKTYPFDEMMTPYEKFKSLPNAKDYLKPGIDFEILDKAAYAMSDNDSAELLQKARNKLFNGIIESEQTAF